MDRDSGGGTIVALIMGYRYSGKSLVLRHLEEAGYACVDNLPLDLVSAYLARHREGKGGSRKYALVVEAGEAEGAEALVRLRGSLVAEGMGCKVTFVETDETSLRERHEAARSGASGSDGGEARRQAEREALAPFRAVADLVIDSSWASPAELRDHIMAFSEGPVERVRCRVEIASFGFKHGAPQGDLVIDVRFIPNPYYVATLRHLTGRDAACAEYVFAHAGARATLDSLTGLVEAMEEAFTLLGRPSLRVKVGCTGGCHRSVAMAEALGVALAAKGIQAAIRHRELDGRPV